MRSSVAPRMPCSAIVVIVASMICSRRSAATDGRAIDVSPVCRARAANDLSADCNDAINFSLVGLDYLQSRYIAFRLKPWFVPNRTDFQGAKCPTSCALTPMPESPLSFPARVRANDGILLATDVYLPGAPDDADATPGDTVLIRLPYDKSGEYCFIPLVAEYFTRHGYRVVAQDVRGKFRSRGRRAALRERGGRRLRDDRVDHPAAVVERPGRDVGRQLLRLHAVGGGRERASGAEGHRAARHRHRRWGSRCALRGERDARRRMGRHLLYPLTHFFDNDIVLWEPDWSRRDFAAQAEEFMAQEGTARLSYDQWYPHPVLLPRFPDGDPFAGRSVPVLHTIGWWDNCAPLSWADVEQISPATRSGMRTTTCGSSRWTTRASTSSTPTTTASRSAPTSRSVTCCRALSIRRWPSSRCSCAGNGSATDCPACRGTSPARTRCARPHRGRRRERRSVELFATVEGVLAPSGPGAGRRRSTGRTIPRDLVPSSVPDRLRLPAVPARRGTARASDRM